MVLSMMRKVRPSSGKGLNLKSFVIHRVHISTRPFIMSKRAADEISDPPSRTKKRVVVSERRSAPTEQCNENGNDGSTAPAPAPAPLPVAAAQYVQRNPQEVAIPLVDAVIMTDNGLMISGEKRASGVGSGSSSNGTGSNSSSSTGKSNANRSTGSGLAAPAPAAGLAGTQRSSTTASASSNGTSTASAAPSAGWGNDRNPVASDRVPISVVCGSPHVLSMMVYGFRSSWGNHTVNRKELLRMLQDGGAHLAVRCMTSKEMESLAMKERSVIKAGRDYGILDLPDSMPYFCFKCYAVLDKYFAGYKETLKMSLCRVDNIPGDEAWLEHCHRGLSHLRDSNVFGDAVSEQTIEEIIEESQTVAGRNRLLPADA